MNIQRFPALALVFCLVSVPSAFAAQSEATYSAGPLLDQALNEAVDTGLIPGAVLIIGHNGQTIYRKAYGHRALVPREEPMTLDTIFDAASLTKVVATILTSRSTRVRTRWSRPCRPS